MNNNVRFRKYAGILILVLGLLYFGGKIVSEKFFGIQGSGYAIGVALGTSEIILLCFLLLLGVASILFYLKKRNTRKDL